MFKVMKLDSVNGEWIEVQSAASLSEAKPNIASEKSYVFWDGDIPESHDLQQKLFDEVYAANGGKVLRVTSGLDLCSAKKESALSGCPGRCFCVIAHGSRGCETYWCSASGWCWWVTCGMGC